METFSDYIPRFQVNMNEIIRNIMELPEVQAEIIRINQEQLTEGIDALGQRIRTIQSELQGENLVYSLYTYGQKVKKGQDPQHVTLKDTGAFWNSMYVKVNEDSAEVLAEFDKPDGNIMENFDNSFDFLGLTEDSLKGFVIWFLQEYLEQSLKKELQVY